MAKVTQEGRPLRITTPLGPDAILLEKFEGTESTSRLFRFRLGLLAEGRSPVEFAKVLGQPAAVSLELPDGRLRYWNGIVGRFSEGPPLTGHKGGDFTRYYADLVPRVWLLTRRRQSRTHSGTVLDIVKNVLQGFDCDANAVQGPFPRRDCCVQYQESDWAFVSRLLEEEGIYSFFTHEADSHHLVLGNTRDAHPELPPLLDLAAAPPRAWRKSQHVAVGKWTVWDYCFETAEKNLGRDQSIVESVQVGDARHSLQLDQHQQREVYEYPGGHGQRFSGIDGQGTEAPRGLEGIGDEAKRLARIRMEAAAAASLTIQARSRLRHLAPGHRFQITQPNHGELVLTQVRHYASQQGTYRSGGDQAFVYRNRFRGVPAGLPYRPPRRTPRPAIRGYQSAIVVGPLQHEAATDKHGRVKLQFHWDRQGRTNPPMQVEPRPLTLGYWHARLDGAETSSGWVRVAQGWAGQGWGQFTLPRVGQEVAVVFLDGDPDRPLVIGSLYNNVNPPPFELPKNALASGWKSRSAGGELEHFNGLAFNDTPGEENAQLQAQRNLILSAKQHLVTNVGGNWFENLNGNRVQMTGTLPGFGEAGGEPQEAATDAPWQWTIGGLNSGIGRTANLVFGQMTTAVCGLMANVVFGCNTSVTINPTSMLDTVAPNLATLLSPVVGTLDGMNSLSLGPMNALTYGTASSIYLGNTVLVSLEDQSAALTVLKNLCRVLAILSTVEVLVFGATGDRIKENWLKPTVPGVFTTMLTIGGGVALSAAALATLVSMQVVLYKTETMKTAASNVKQSIGNLRVAAYLADPSAILGD